MVRKNRWGRIQDWSDVGEDKLEGPHHRGFGNGICSDEQEYVPRIINVFKRSNKTYIVIENAHSLLDVWSDMADGRLHGVFGPFASVQKFHAHLGHDFVRANPEMFEYCQEAFKLCRGKKYSTVFSHCDLGPYKILIRDGKIAAIVDWEFGEWYPEYWEHCQLFLSNLRFPDIQELVKSGAVTELYDDEHRVEGYLGGIFTRC